MESFNAEKMGALEEMRKNVEELTDVTSDFMLEDYYLEKWLHKTNYSIKDIVYQFKRYLKWRDDNKMNSILEEDWTKMRQKFPFSVANTDRHGRPILYRKMGDWDMAGFLKKGQAAFDRVLRYVLMVHEAAEVRLREIRLHGSNATTFVHLMNADGFTIERYGTAPCLELVSRATQLFANSTFDMGDVVIINAPKAFRVLYNTAKGTNARLFDQARAHWEEELSKFIDADQFPDGILRDIPERDNNDGLVEYNQVMHHY